MLRKWALASRSPLVGLVGHRSPDLRRRRGIASVHEHPGLGHPRLGVPFQIAVLEDAGGGAADLAQRLGALAEGVEDLGLDRLGDGDVPGDVRLAPEQIEGDADRLAGLDVAAEGVERRGVRGPGPAVHVTSGGGKRRRDVGTGVGDQGRGQLEHALRLDLPGFVQQGEEELQDAGTEVGTPRELAGHGRPGQVEEVGQGALGLGHAVLDPLLQVT